MYSTGLSFRHPAAFGVLVGVVLCLALVAGGSSSDTVSAGIVRIASIPILAIGLWRQCHRPVSPVAFWLFTIIVAAMGFVLIQLAPLPPRLWTALPGRETVLAGYVTAGMTPPWLPISLTPWKTQDAVLGLIPPVAMFCAVSTLEESARRTLALTILAMAVASVGVGVMQIAGGADSPFRIYDFTNRDSAVGFFANRNHQAAFLAASLPLATFLTLRTGRRDAPHGFFWMSVAGGAVLVVSLGCAITGSRAGAVLLALGLLGAVAVSARSGRRTWAPAALLAVAVVLAAALVAVSGHSTLVDRFRTHLGDDLRVQINPVAARAGRAFAPVGAGVGSFPDIYQMFEPVQMVGPAYVNHAHDEYLELWLEGGWAAAALILAFLAWWGAVTFGVLTGRSSQMAALQTAGCLIVAMFMLHSVVDYPLRTPALAAILGFACALMTPPPRRNMIVDAAPTGKAKLAASASNEGNGL
jgi:O-antigen ligase